MTSHVRCIDSIETGIMNRFSGYIGQVPSSAHALHNCDTNITVICKHDDEQLVADYDL